MERYNIFQLIHKGLRASLYQTALQLQQTDFVVEEETENAINKVKEIVMLFDGHAHKEDKYVLPAIAAYEPSVVADFESEHETDIQLGEELHNSIERLENSNSPSARITAGSLLTECFITFMVFNLQHMAKEEDVINRILWRYYSDEEIKKISTRIAQQTPPWIQEFYATWMLRGINDTEAATWFKAIENGMPPVVFETLMIKAEQELPYKRFRRLARSFSQKLQPA